MDVTDLPSPIVVTTTDLERLSDLVNAAQHKLPDIAEFLTAELERADVVPPEQVPADVVTMNARVRFRDETSGEVRTVTLVYPQEQDMAQGKISVLTPVGAALIGLSTGQSIRWQTRLGAYKTLTVLGVEPVARDASGAARRGT